MCCPSKEQPQCIRKPIISMRKNKNQAFGMISVRKTRMKLLAMLDRGIDAQSINNTQLCVARRRDIINMYHAKKGLGIFG